ncbi:MAG: radical SAM protein [Syntrophaceae bacterium]
MKVAIINPPYPLEEAPSPPLGVCYVAGACLQAGCEVRIFDFLVCKYTPEKLADAIDAFKPDVIGSTSVTMNFKAAADIITTAKRHNPAIITMMGGPHVSFDWRNTLAAYPEIDLIVLGEGEQTLKELLPYIQNRETWETVPGLAFRQDGRIVTSGPRAFITDLDSLPVPARHLLPMSRYLALGFPVSIITSRGCPNQCIFCLGRRMVGHKVRYRTPKLVVDEIEDILSYGFTRINIADDLFTSNKQRVAAFCDELKRRRIKITWTAFARVNTVDPEVLTMMRDAGCDCISFGIESGNPEMLKRIKKGITLDQARRAIQYCKEVGIGAHASFMVGLPGESPSTINDSSVFAESLDIDYGYHLLAPFPGTTVREELSQFDLTILTDDWNLYDANVPVVCTSGLSPDQMADFVKGYEDKHRQIWDEMTQKVAAGDCTDYEYLRVAGFERMQLVFKLLNTDLIEEHGTAADMDALSGRISQATGMKPGLVAETLKQLSQAGYLKTLSVGDKSSWYWTHNNRADLP